MAYGSTLLGLISPVLGFMQAVVDVFGYINVTRSGFGNH
jgi:hypothetical protein